MNFKTMLVLAAFAATSAGAAFAQDQGGQGHMQPSPEMQAARQAMREACASDAKTLCDGKTGRDMMMCMRDNADKVSQPCKDAMAKMPRRQPQSQSQQPN